MRHHLWNYSELSSFCTELYLILKAGIPTAEGVLLLAEDERDPSRRRVLTELGASLEGGAPIGDALRSMGAFPDYMAELMDIGHQTGYLDTSLQALADYYRRRDRLAMAVRSTVLWPMLLFVILLSVVSVLIVAVLPVFESVFHQLGATLSPVAAWFLGVGSAVRRFRWPLLSLLATALFLTLGIICIPALRRRGQNLLRRTFSASRTGCLVGRAHLAAALSMAIASGLDFDAALEMGVRLTANDRIRTRAEQCREKMGNGEHSFAAAVADTELFDPLQCRLLSVGMRTGAADTAMAEIARRAQTEADTALEKLVGRIEPTLVAVMSVLIGVVLLSVMLPLLGVMSALT